MAMRWLQIESNRVTWLMMQSISVATKPPFKKWLATLVYSICFLHCNCQFCIRALVISMTDSLCNAETLAFYAVLSCSHSIASCYPRTTNSSSSNTQKSADGNRLLSAFIVLTWSCLLSLRAVVLFSVPCNYNGMWENKNIPPLDIF